MPLFGNNEPVILKEGTSSKRHLATLQSLRGKLPAEAERRLEADIRALRAGITGEERILYELRNSHMQMYVIQDLRLEHEGLSAQIDFLVLTRQRNFIIECKNLYGDIEVNERGDFLRTFGGHRREGIYSPVAQNRRHVELIRAMKRADRSLVANLILDSDFDDVYRSLVVLANPKTVLDDRRAPEDVKSKIVRADQLVAAIAAANAEKGPGREKSTTGALQRNAEWFLANDASGSGNGGDYAAKYRGLTTVGASNPERCSAGKATGSRWPEPANAQAWQGAVPEPSPIQPRASTQAKAAWPQTATQTVLCPRCGAPMVLRTAKRGEWAGNQFYGCSNYPNCNGIVNIKR